jgi:polyphosphate:AMP phosphotransferase
MLETVDLSAELAKSEYKDTQDALDLRLGELQRSVRAAGIPVIVVFEGWDAAGKGSVLSRLLQPLDPRGYTVKHINPPTDTERFFPPMRRFWLSLPNDGAMAVYNHSWYRQVLHDRVDDGLAPDALQAAYERIRIFERQLADGGAVIAKFFLHISKKEQARRFEKLEDSPAFAWKVSKAAKKRHKKYDAYAEATEDMLRETSTAHARWTLVPATDQRFACVKVAETLAAVMEHGLAVARQEPAPAPPNPPRRTSPLDRVDLSRELDKGDYEKQLDALQAEARRLQHICYAQRVPVAMVFEGWDAGGKGGAIRRLVRELDPRGYEVAAIGAPAGEEKTHHYLWRFWKRLPKAGHFTLFDRSWYGRVLVERVEGFAQPQEWTRAFREINEFEAELVEYGMVLFKFWLHISKDEQLARFEARQENPHKQWKITDEDWRNREKWDAYWEAVSDLIERTSTAEAPWTLVEGNDKRFARIRVLRTVTEGLSTILE